MGKRIVLSPLPVNISARTTQLASLALLQFVPALAIAQISAAPSPCAVEVEQSLGGFRGDWEVRANFRAGADRQDTLVLQERVVARGNEIIQESRFTRPSASGFTQVDRRSADGGVTWTVTLRAEYRRRMPSANSAPRHTFLHRTAGSTPLPAPPP